MQMSNERTVPEGWDADPGAILSHLETLLAAGLTLERVSRHSGVRQDKLQEWLERNAEYRRRIGAKSYQHDDYQDRSMLFSLSAWIGEYEDATREERERYSDTPTGAYFRSIALAALKKKQFILFMGGYGIGKTTEARRLAMAYPMTREKPGAAYMEITDDDRAPARIYQKISDSIRLNERLSARGIAIGKRVRDALRPGDLLIMDEANYLLTYGTWACVRDILDTTPASILLISNPLANSELKKNADQMGAFISRVTPYYVDKTTPEDVEKVLHDRGISGEALYREAVRQASQQGPNGGLRRLCKVLDDAEEQMAIRGIPMDLKLFKRCSTRFIL